MEALLSVTIQNDNLPGCKDRQKKKILPGRETCQRCPETRRGRTSDCLAPERNSLQCPPEATHFYTRAKMLRGDKQRKSLRYVKSIDGGRGKPSQGQLEGSMGWRESHGLTPSDVGEEGRDVGHSGAGSTETRAPLAVQETLRS